MCQCTDLYSSEEIQKQAKYKHQQDKNLRDEARKALDYIISSNFVGDFFTMYNLILERGYKTTRSHVYHIMWEYVANQKLDFTDDWKITVVS